jgi:DNA-directed RNA polymerase specialized sigma24 family protein
MSHRLYLSDDLLLEKLAAVLAEDGWREELWDDLAESLARYGLRVIGSWTATGEIFTVLVRQRVRYERPMRDEHYPSREDAAEITNETVARGLVKLREILAAQGWSTDGGARLRTFFITQCLFQFPNVYRRWRREIRSFELTSDEFLAGVSDPAAGPDLASRVVTQRQAVEMMRAMPSDALRFAFQMRADGHSVAEVAATLGVLPKQLENLLGRYRRGQRAVRQDWQVD